MSKARANVPTVFSDMPIGIKSLSLPIIVDSIWEALLFPDHSGHKFGPDSPEIKTVICRMDNVTGNLSESLQNRELLNR